MRRTLPLLVGAALFVLTAGVAMAQGAPTTGSEAAVPGAASTPGGQTQPMKHTHKMMRHHRRMHHKKHKASSSMAPASAPTS